MADKFEIDHIIAICNGCRQQRTFWPDKHLLSAQEFIKWTKDPANLTPCVCGATTCDLKAHLVDALDNVLKSASD